MPRELVDEPRANTVEDAICQLHALITSSQRHLLGYIYEFDTTLGWRRDGATSMVNWLCQRLNVSYVTARDLVASAHALRELPATDRAFDEGRLSFDQVRELVRFATPEQDEELAAQAPGWSAAEVRRRARAEQPLTHADATFNKRYLQTRWDDRERMLLIRGQLSEIEGAIFEKGLERMVAELDVDPRGRSMNQLQADALVQLASLRLGADADVDRATIVVAVDMETLAGGDGVGHLENGVPVSIDAVRRVACDARVQPFVTDNAGEPVGVGRATRKIPSWLRRQLKERDGRCNFPGCEFDKWLHAHHVRHWADGGPTDAHNLVMLCSNHHRLVHDGGWKMRRDAEGELEWIRPNGLPLRREPERLRPEIRERFLGSAAASAGHDPP